MQQPDRQDLVGSAAGTDSSSSRLKRRVLHGACGGLMAAVPIVLWDADSLQRYAIAHRTGLGLSATAGFLVVLASAIFAALMIAVFGPPLGQWQQRWRQTPVAAGAHALWLATGLVALEAGVYAAVLVGQRLLEPWGVTQWLVPVSVVAVAAIWLAARPSFDTTVRRRLRRHQMRRSAVVISALLGIMWLGLNLLLALPILKQLELRPIGSWTAIVVATLLGVCIPPFAERKAARMAMRGYRGLALLVVLVGLGSIGRSALVPLPQRLYLALELRATSTASLLKLWTHRSGYVRKPPANTSSSRSATCFPDVPPPDLEGIARSATNADILFITVDALRFDRMSLSGYSRQTTPQIDRHAASALTFERAYSLSVTTRQTFRGLLTGVYGSLVHEVHSSKSNWGFGFTDAQITLAEMLRHGGYETIAYSTEAPIFSAPDGALDGFTEVDESAWVLRDEEGHSVDHLVGQIIERLSQPRVNNRFVWTHVMTPHHPYPVGPEPVHFGYERADQYDAAIHYLDSELGRLLDFVRAPIRAEHTWLILTADHGEGWWEHGTQGHGADLYEEFVRVPMMVWGPGVTARRVQTPISQIHLVPTILELAGLTVPRAICGTSLGPALRGAAPPQEPIYIDVIPDFGRPHFRAALIRDEVKTAIRPNSGLREIFDLSVDPGEKHNLVDERPALLDQELDAMRSFHRRHGFNSESYGL